MVYVWHKQHYDICGSKNAVYHIQRIERIELQWHHFPNFKVEGYDNQNVQTHIINVVIYGLIYAIWMGRESRSYTSAAQPSWLAICIKPTSAVFSEYSYRTTELGTYSWFTPNLHWKNTQAIYRGFLKWGISKSPWVSTHPVTVIHDFDESLTGGGFGGWRVGTRAWGSSVSVAFRTSRGQKKETIFLYENGVFSNKNQGFNILMVAQLTLIWSPWKLGSTEGHITWRLTWYINGCLKQLITHLVGWFDFSARHVTGYWRVT